MAVVGTSIENRAELNSKNFLMWIPLLKRYISGQLHFQIESLISVQILIHRLGHPNGELLWPFDANDGILTRFIFLFHLDLNIQD